MELTPLDPAQRFGLAVTNTKEGKDLHAECSYTAKHSIKLSIRHGAGLVLRNTLWYVTRSKMDDSVIGHDRCTVAHWV